MNTKFSLNLRRACMLALIALSIAFAGNTASAQRSQSEAGFASGSFEGQLQLMPTFDGFRLQTGPQDPQSMGMPAPQRQPHATRDWTAEDVTPFGDTPPVLDFSWFMGQVGNDVSGGRRVGIQTVREFTTDKAGPEAEKWKTVNMTIFVIKTPIPNSTELGNTEIGRTTRDSWVSYMVSRDGWVAIKFDLAGASIFTSNENHLSGGAFEGTLVAYRNKFGGWCVKKHLSSPEGFAVSSFGKRVNYGSFTGGEHILTCEHCGWKLPTYDERFNHLAVNQLTQTGDEVGWVALGSWQPGTPVNFGFGIVNLKMPAQ